MDATISGWLQCPCLIRLFSVMRLVPAWPLMPLLSLHRGCRRRWQPIEIKIRSGFCPSGGPGLFAAGSPQKGAFQPFERTGQIRFLLKETGLRHGGAVCLMLHAIIGQGRRFAITGSRRIGAKTGHKRLRAIARDLRRRVLSRSSPNGRWPWGQCGLARLMIAFRDM